MCAHRLRFAQSLGEKRSEGRDSVSEPQKFELREGSVSCRVFDQIVHPPFWLHLF